MAASRLLHLAVITVFVCSTVAETTTENPLTYGNGIQVFKLVTPKKRLTAKFNSPVATLNWVELLVHPSVDNFSLCVESSKPHIASVPQDLVVLKLCDSKDSAVNPIHLQRNTTDKQLESSLFNSTHQKYSQANDSTQAVKINQQNVENKNKWICYNVTFKAFGERLGYSTVTFKTKLSEGHHLWNVSSETVLESLVIACVRFYRPIDKVFRVTVFFMVGIATLGMGNELNFQTIKTHLKKPKAPAIAFVSQFTVMPLLSYAVIYIMGFKGGAALGLFTLGCSPGGGQSNMYSKLLNGDLSLSVTMTTLSTVASLGMLPLWMYTLGATLPIDEEIGRIKIPFLNIFVSLCVLLGPLAVGVLIKYKLPKLSKILKKCLKVFFLVLILFFFTVGIYSNLYIYQSFNAKLVFSCALIPYGGYLCGGLLAWVCRMDWKLIKTIGLETGMQNVGVCALVVQSVMKSPDSDLAFIAPIAATLMTSLPCYLITPIYLLRQRCKRNKRSTEKNSESGDEADEKLNDLSSEREMLEVNRDANGNTTIVGDNNASETDKMAV